MLPGLYSAASALNAAALNQEVVARNLAHVNVPGFRRSTVALKEFEGALQNAGTAEPLAETGLGTEVSQVQVDFSIGPIAHTGRNLDVALGGDAFFVVDGPDGPLYTRNGVFQLNEQGELVNNSGYPVQGSSGPIAFPADATPQQIQIGRDGSIGVGPFQVGTLRVVAFEDNQQLVPAGTTLFSAPSGLAPQETDVTVQQGARELSNVVAVEELVRMIVGLRHYEAATRAMRSISEAVQQNTNPQAG